MNSYNDDIKTVATQSLDWNLLTGKNILITGATGLIGSCLVDVLMSENLDAQIYALGRNEERARKRFSTHWNSDKFHFLSYDVSQPLSCNIDFHYIIHAASNASPNFFISSPVEVMKSNIYGTVNLMEYGINHNLQKFLYVSSGEVYGEGEGKKFSEKDSGYIDCTLSRSCYPSAKRATETLCICYATEYGVDVNIARPCHVYGPHFTESDNRVYAQFIRNVRNDEDIIMKSTGEQYRSWCYVVDCASALLYILLKGENGQAYNIADENSCITIRELAELTAKIGGKQVIMQLPDDQEKRGYNPVKTSTFDTTKLKGLGWNIKGNMEEKMRSTIETLK